MRSLIFPSYANGIKLKWSLKIHTSPIKFTYIRGVSKDSMIGLKQSKICPNLLKYNTVAIFHIMI